MKKRWIILAVFIATGVVPALGYTADGALFVDTLARGAGATLAVSVLACLGLLYRPNKNLGFGISAAIFSALILVASSRMTTTPFKSGAGGEMTSSQGAEQPEERLGVWKVKRTTDKMTDDVLTFATAKFDGGQNEIVDIDLVCRTGATSAPILLASFRLPGHGTSSPRLRFDNGPILEKTDASSHQFTTDFLLSRSDVESYPRLRIEFPILGGVSSKVFVDINGRDPSVQAVYRACLSGPGEFADAKSTDITRVSLDYLEAAEQVPD